MWSGAAAATACTVAVVLRGSPPGTSSTGTPAARRLASAPTGSTPTPVSATVAAGADPGRVRGRRGGGVADGVADGAAVLLGPDVTAGDGEAVGAGVAPGTTSTGGAGAVRVRTTAGSWPAGTSVTAPNRFPVAARSASASAPAATGTTVVPAGGSTGAAPTTSTAPASRRAISASTGAGSPPAVVSRTGAPRATAAVAAVSWAATSSTGATTTTGADANSACDTSSAASDGVAAGSTTAAVSGAESVAETGAGVGVGLLDNDVVGRGSTAEPSSVHAVRSRTARRGRVRAARRRPTCTSSPLARNADQHTRARLADRGFPPPPGRASVGDDKPPGSAGALRVRPDTTSHPQTRGT